MRIKTWNIEAVTGYKPQTTFYEDFSIADAFGVSAIKDTCKNARACLLDGVRYGVELENLGTLQRQRKICDVI